MIKHLPPDLFSQALPRDKDNELSTRIDHILSERTPEMLYHFTNLPGIVGIVTSSKLWTTNAQYLNDSMEVKFGIKMIRRVVKAKAARIRPHNPVAADFLDELLNSAERLFVDVFDVYVACFSDNHDILSQWRNYGSGCFALEFDVTRLRGLRSHPSAFPAFPLLQRVVYSHDTRKARIRTILDLLISYLPYAGTVTDPDDAGRNLLEIAANVLFSLIPSFKHPSFREEREWRLVKYFPRNDPGQVTDLLYRIGKYGLTPYFTLSAPAGTLPITKVFYGPAPYVDDSINSLRTLMGAQGYNFDFEKYDTTYRF